MTSPPHVSRFSRPKLLGFALLLATTVWLCLFLTSAWKQSVRREAYLPDLEAMAIQNSNDGPLLGLLGARLMEAQEHTAAAATFERAIADGHVTENLLLSFAASSVAAGNVSRARTILENGVQSLPDASNLRSTWTRVQALPPSTPPGYIAQTISPLGPALLVRDYTRGSLFNGYFEWQGQRNPEQSGYATRQRWITEKPNDPETLRLWGLALWRNRRIEEAGPTLRRAVDLAPDSIQTRVAFAQLLAETGFSSKAGQQYMECLKRDLNNVPALMDFGRLSLAQGLRYAGDCFKRATELNPRLAEAWIGLGRAYLKSDATATQAAQAFDTATRLEPHDTEFFINYATALEKSQRSTEAEAILRRRLAVMPDDAEAHYRLAGVLAQNNPTPEREVEAETEGREALRLSPEAVGAKSQLGQLLLRRGNIKEAVALLEDADKGDPYVVNTKNFLARAYARLGRQEESAAMLQRAQALFTVQQRISVLETQRKAKPMDAQVVEQLAVLYAQNGQKNQAMLSHDLARQIRTNPGKVAEDLDRLKKLVQSAGLKFQ